MPPPPYSPSWLCVSELMSMSCSLAVRKQWECDCERKRKSQISVLGIPEPIAIIQLFAKPRLEKRWRYIFVMPQARWSHDCWKNLMSVLHYGFVISAQLFSRYSSGNARSASWERQSSFCDPPDVFEERIRKIISKNLWMVSEILWIIQIVLSYQSDHILCVKLSGNVPHFASIDERDITHLIIHSTAPNSSSFYS